MNLEIAIREENGTVILKVTSPDKPVVIETAAAEQNENVSPATEAVKPAETLKAEAAALSEKVAALKREYERLKKAAYRAGKRLEENRKGLGQSVTAAGNYCPEIAIAGCPAPVPRVPETCPQTVPSTVPKNNKGQLKTKDIHHFIPLDKLPEVYQKVLTTWNGLPLPEKLSGLYTDVAQKLNKLLKEYGEAAVQKAIRMVADSPFLLGKISNTRGWQHIYFGWLLNPVNLKKILENRYRNRQQDDGCVTYPEYIPWSAVKNAVNSTTVTANAYTESNTALPCYLDPSYMLQGLDPLTDHARSCLTHEAALLGLTKTSAA